MQNPKGFFGIGIYHTKNELNVGGLWRSANLFGASFVFTIGRRYKRQASDTMNTPKHIPMFHYQDFDDFQKHRPSEGLLIGVEQNEHSKPVQSFVHPKQAIYLLGAEDSGLPQCISSKCQYVIEIPTPRCLNVHVAGSIVLYDRALKCGKSL